MERDDPPRDGTTDMQGGWGERTPRGRLVTYCGFAIASLVCAIVWFSGAIEVDGIGSRGYVVFPLVFAIFAWKAYRAWGELKQERHGATH